MAADCHLFCQENKFNIHSQVKTSKKKLCKNNLYFILSQLFPRKTRKNSKKHKFFPNINFICLEIKYLLKVFLFLSRWVCCDFGAETVLVACHSRIFGYFAFLNFFWLTKCLSFEMMPGTGKNCFSWKIS